MKNTLKIQKDGVNTLKEEVLTHSNNELKKIYIVASDMKESGYDIIEECLIDLKARKFIAFGIDKKNTTKKMLEGILKYTKNLYIWNNNQDEEFCANVLAFEYDSEAYVYSLSGSITENLFETDFSLYNKITFDLVEDKKEYEDYIECVTSSIKNNFVKVTKELINELTENKQIFTTKQYLHTLPSISELLGKKEEKMIENKEKVEIPKIKIDTDKLDGFEIDLGDLATQPEVETVNADNLQNTEVQTSAFGLDEYVEDIQEEQVYNISDEAIDMEALILDSEVVKLDKTKIGKNNKSLKEEKTANKKINLSKVSNIIMELSKKPTRGKDVSKIKIPNYIKDMIPSFFEIMEDAKVVNIDGKEYKEATINIETIDVNNSNRYVDKKARLRQKIGQTYLEFETDSLCDVLYEELDIARIIKLAKDSYHIEIIPKGIEEYSLWKKLCTNSFRGSSKMYGLM